MSAVRIAVYAAGEKGRAFLAAVLADERAAVVDVRTYAQVGTLDDSDALIDSLCAAHGIPVRHGARNGDAVDESADLIFVVGWQYLLPRDPRIVVFHDSLLPRFRGFAPTATALILGESEIGVTALRPAEQPDVGPILAQHAQPVIYPLTIRDALDGLTQSYVLCAREVITRFAAGDLTEVPQDEARATHSIWRGDDDYVLDWAEDALRICRTVDALGWPYPGARTHLGSASLTVLAAVPGPDLRFEITQPGKVWSLADGVPTVVAGRGTVILTDVRDENGRPFLFDRLRVRLG